MAETSGNGPPQFEEVYDRYYGDVLRFCTLQVGNRTAAEDLTAEVFLHAYQGRERMPHDSDGIRPWLFRIARNKAIDQWRREQRLARLLRFLHVADRVASVDDSFDHPEFDRVMTIFGRLSAKDRQLLSLRIASDMSNREVGRVLGISEDTAAHAVRRAVRRFRRLNEEMP